MNQKQAWNITACFILTIGIITIATLLHPQRSFSERENRSLTMRPAVTAQDVFSGKFEESYEDYLKDQFIFRDTWIAVRTRAEQVLQKKEVHDVYFAKDDYLIEKHTGVFTTQQAENNITFLSGFINSISGQIDPDRISVIIVPNAVSILKDKLPLLASPYPETEYLDQISSRIPGEIWVDAANVLSAHSDEYIFYRTDHHWTTKGAFYVFQNWMAVKNNTEITEDMYDSEVLTDSFEGTVASKVGVVVKDDTIEAYHSKQEPAYELIYNQTDDIRHSILQTSVLDSRDKYSVFFGGNYGLIETITQRSDADSENPRKLLVIKDSYAHCFASLLLDYYDEIDFLDLRYFNQSLSEFMNEKQYTDVLFLYNAAGFAEDTSLSKLTM